MTRIPSVHLASVSLSYLPSPASPLLATLVSLSSPYPAERLEELEATTVRSEA